LKQFSAAPFIGGVDISLPVNKKVETPFILTGEN
jgi:hypothetical protein